MFALIDGTSAAGDDSETVQLDTSGAKTEAFAETCEKDFTASRVFVWPSEPWMRVLGWLWLLIIYSVFVQ